MYIYEYKDALRYVFVYLFIYTNRCVYKYICLQIATYIYFLLM